ncbi:MAG TPA: PH domain-containing protein [Pirellulaceae bacterium]|nr:PH domain-containing protein [Pirellulaceae bacterium]
MKCPACAADVAAESVYCPQCGQRLDAPPAAAPPAKTHLEHMQAAKAARAPAGDDAELPLWKGGFSWKAMLGYWLLAIVATIVAIVVAVIFAAMPAVGLAAGAIVLVLWIFLVVYYLYLRFSLAYELTNQRLIHHHGILTRVTNRIETIDIDDIKFTQNLIERFLGVGTIQILSSDVSDPKLVIRGIDDVKHVFAIMDDARRDERRKRGMYIDG